MRIALVVAAVGLATGCGSSPPSSRPPSASPAPNKPAETGPLSEAQFKALHELPTDGPPVRAGQRIELAGGSAYLSVPAGTGPFPAIIVIHEWWGLNANIEHWADRLASAGWAAVAVDLYGKVATTREDALALMKAVDPAKARATIKAALDLVTNDARIAAPVQAVIGWCFGGGWSLQSALAFPELDGAIIYYGQLELDPGRLSAIRAQVLGIFGNLDEGIPVEAVKTFDAALTTAGVRHEIVRYDAPHAFANPSNPKYDAQAAADAWQRVLAFLARLRT